MPESDAAKQPLPQSTYDSARGNLLFAAVCTLVNAVLLFAKSDFRFLFSAFLPTLLADFGALYADGTGMAASALGTRLLALGIAGIFFLCWMLSGRHRGAMTAALVLFGMDCVFFIAGFFLYDLSLNLVINAVFHLWILWTLIRGVRAAALLGRMEREPMILISDDAPQTEKVSDAHEKI